MERGAREFMKSLISIHDTECQIISFHGANAGGAGIVNEKAISFRGGLILPFLIDSHIALAKCRLVWKILLRNDRALCIHIEFQPPQQKNLLMIITFSHILFAFV